MFIYQIMAAAQAILAPALITILAQCIIGNHIYYVL